MKLSYVLAFAALLSSVAWADEWDKRTAVTFHEPVEVPGLQNHGHGIVLPPGTYVMKLLDSASDRDIVQILNRNETQVYTTTITIPEYRMEPTGKTVIRFEERPEGSPEAIRDWFYPGDLRGEEFLYSKPLLMHAQNSAPAVTTVATAKPAPPPAPAAAPAVAPAPVVENSQPAPAPQATAPFQIAQTTPAPAHSQPKQELPKTASDLPLVGLAGLVSVAAGAALRKNVA